MLSPLSIADTASTLARCIETGSPMAPAMEELSRRFPRGEKQILLSAVERLRDGVPVSRAFEGVLPPELAALLDSEGSRLPQVLRNVETHQRLQARLRRSWKRLALTFLLQVFAGALVLTLVMGILRTTSKVGEVYTQVSISVPLVTRIGIWLGQHPWLLFVTIAGVPLSLVAIPALLLRSRWGGALMYALPLWGRMLKTNDLHIVCSIVAMRLHAGFGIHDALLDAHRLLRNARMKQSLWIVSERLKEGIPISDAMSDQRVFPPALVWAVKCAEQSGDVAAVFETFAELYARDQEFLLESVSGAIPLLGTLCFGALMALWATMILLPLILLLNGMGRRLGSDDGWLYMADAAFWVGGILLVIFLFYALLSRWKFSIHSIVDHLATLVQKGIPLTRAVGPVSQDYAGLLPSGLSQVQRRLEQGRTLSEAFRTASSGLPPILINAIQVGEAGGNPGPALAQVRDYLRRRRQEPQGFSFGALTYVLFLTLFIAAGSTFTSLSAVPRFQDTFQQLGVGNLSDLELYGWASKMAWVILLGIVLFACFALAHILRAAPMGASFGFRGLLILPLRLGLFLTHLLLTPFRILLDRMFDKVPLLNRFRRDESLWTVASSLSVLLRCGAALPDALRAISSLRLDTLTRRKVEALCCHVEEGQTISSFVEHDPFFPPEFRWLLRVGEPSGNLASILSQAAEFIEKRAQMRRALAVRTAIPSMVVLNGLLVFGMAHPTFAALARVIDGVRLW